MTDYGFCGQDRARSLTMVACFADGNSGLNTYRQRRHCRHPGSGLGFENDSSQRRREVVRETTASSGSVTSTSACLKNRNVRTPPARRKSGTRLKRAFAVGTTSPRIRTQSLEMCLLDGRTTYDWSSEKRIRNLLATLRPEHRIIKVYV